MDLKLNAFVKSNIDETADVVMVFGLDQKDLDGCSFSDPKCKGVAQWDPNFNPNAVEAQLALQVRFKQKKTLNLRPNVHLGMFVSNNLTTAPLLIKNINPTVISSFMTT